MNIETLKNNLLINQVPDQWYSLDEGLKPDALILYKNYSKWEFFYLDERGGRNEFRIFYNEEEAYDFLWEKIQRQLEVLKQRS